MHHFGTAILSLLVTAGIVAVVTFLMSVSGQFKHGS